MTISRQTHVLTNPLIEDDVHARSWEELYEELVELARPLEQRNDLVTPARFVQKTQRFDLEAFIRTEEEKEPSCK